MFRYRAINKLNYKHDNNGKLKENHYFLVDVPSKGCLNHCIGYVDAKNAQGKL